MNHLKKFGCIIYVRNTMPHWKKLEDHRRKMIFVGYESGSKAYRAYDPIKKHVHVTCDMVFDKQDQSDWSISGDNGEPGGGSDIFTVEYTTIG
jgi:hypothetical protein